MLQRGILIVVLIVVAMYGIYGILCLVSVIPCCLFPPSTFNRYIYIKHSLLNSMDKNQDKC